MKKSRLFLALLFVSLSFVLLPTTAKADVWDVPVGPGESFRWVFVTSQTTQALSSDISFYNDFVNQVADDADTPITNVVGFSSIAEIDWMAIASTADGADAIDNIGTSTAGIYNPIGTLVANGTADMFDGSLEHAILLSEYGTWPGPHAWTGSNNDGTAHPDYALGNPDAATGSSQYTTHWLYTGYPPSDEYRLLFAISEDLTVVPAPAAVILAATGLLSSTLGLKRLRRKHQEQNQI